MKCLFPIPNHVREYRLRYGFTVVYLASLVGISRNALTLIENGTFSPSLATAYSLCCVFHCGFEDLFEFPVLDVPDLPESVFVGGDS